MNQIQFLTHTSAHNVSLAESFINFTVQLNNKLNMAMLHFTPSRAPFDSDVINQ